MATYTNNFEGLWSIADHKIKDFSLENQPLALGVSGGADSIGLFYVFCHLVKQKKIFDLVVFHINFGLRGEESDGDERFVRELCEENSVKLEVFKPTEVFSNSIQESARNFRHEIQNTFLEKNFKIVLAHNSDDVAENILFRLARGSSINHAAGMEFFDGNIFRPWLEVSRSHIREALSQKNLSWRDDSSNTKAIYSRNKIRLEVLPVLEELFPGATKRIADSFLNLPAEFQAVDPSIGFKCPMSDFKTTATLAISTRLHSLLSQFYGGKSPVQRQVVEQIANSIHTMSTGLDGQPRIFHLPQHVELQLSRQEVSIRVNKSDKKI